MAYLNIRPLSQGEVTFFPVTPDHFDGAAFKATEQEVGGAYIVAHSEKGHHHVIERDRAEVVTVVQSAAGMTILRTLVADPDGATVINRGAHGHAPLHLPPDLYEARINREVGMDDLIRRAAD